MKREETGYPRIVNITCPRCGRMQRAAVHFYAVLRAALAPFKEKK